MTESEHYGAQRPEEVSAQIRNLDRRVTRLEYETGILRPGVNPPVPPPSPLPEPVEPPPVRPPRVPRLGDNVFITEMLGGLSLRVRFNPAREVVGNLEPRRSRCIVVGNVAEWGRLNAKALGWEPLPRALHERLANDSAQDTASTDPNPYYGEPASGGGGWGIARWYWDWKRGAHGLPLALANMVGTINRASIVADWQNIEWPDGKFAYSLHRQNSALPGYPMATSEVFGNTPDHSHLSRLWSSAAFIYEFTGSEVALWWMRQVWTDTALALGVGVDKWETQGAHPAWRSNFTPFHELALATREEKHHGWLGRQYMHQLRFALELVRLGVNVPGAEVTPLAAVEIFRDAIETHAAASPWHDDRKYVLQYSPANTAGGGYPVENLPFASKENRRMALGGENALWVPELRAAGMHMHANGLAAWLGLYPAWAVSLDDAMPRDTSLRWGGGATAGSPARWYDIDVYASDRVPHTWRFTHPEVASAAELLFAATGPGAWGSRRENLAMDSTPREVRMELLGF